MSGYLYVQCSSCGQQFHFPEGRDSGFSHCDTHAEWEALSEDEEVTIEAVIPIPEADRRRLMDALATSEGISQQEWDALIHAERDTIAKRYPVRDQGNGTKWYRSAPVAKEGREGGEKLGFNQLGWTSNPGWADPSYGVGDGKGNAF